jgi:hypothetical protein
MTDPRDESLTDSIIPPARPDEPDGEEADGERLLPHARIGVGEGADGVDHVVDGGDELEGGLAHRAQAGAVGQRRRVVARVGVEVAAAVARRVGAGAAPGLRVVLPRVQIIIAGNSLI